MKIKSKYVYKFVAVSLSQSDKDEKKYMHTDAKYIV